MRGERFLAIDIGAESGRGIVGTVEGGRIRIEEVHRFPNRPIWLFGHLHWNVFDLYSGVVEAISKAASGDGLRGIGIDTWAVDYVLLGPGNVLLGPPYHYRDSRTAGIMERAFATMPAEEIYAETGIQFLPFNTLYQLIAETRAVPSRLELARSLLMMGEYIAFLLTGEQAAEFTNATTTQLVNPRSRTWADRLFETFGLPRRLMPAVVEPGTVLGRLHADLAERTGAGPVDVILPAVHDTGSAVAAVPAGGHDWCYLSSGTWSLLGIEVDEPVITPAAFAFGLTNEGGVRGTFRLLKNVMGLWLLQECRRTWASMGNDMSYPELARLAAAAEPFRTVIDPDDRRFLSPGDMPEKIRSYARETGQPEPASPGEMVRCILESLALKYRYVVEGIERATGRSIRAVHVVGGGSQNRLLNQFTADATGRVVLAGPAEATAAGNVLVQAMAKGLFADLADARAAVRRSFALEEYVPGDRSSWDEAYGRLVERLRG
ncbi:MAG: rhamnulokinase [Firmicutes bacterium]|nr:rhamnulokinase [Bacillota bacterium]